MNYINHYVRKNIWIVKLFPLLNSWWTEGWSDELEMQSNDQEQLQKVKVLENREKKLKLKSRLFTNDLI